MENMKNKEKNKRPPMKHITVVSTSKNNIA